MPTVKRSELVGILASIKPALAKRDIIPQAQHFIFANDEVFAYNDELFISHPFQTGLSCSVKADEFYKILSKMSVEKVDLEVKDGVLHIAAGKTKGKLAIEEDGQIYQLVEGLHLDKLEWKKFGKDFLEGVELCMYSACTDASQGAITCVHVNGQDLFSTDDVRISWFQMESKMDQFLLPARAAQQLVKFDVIEYAATDSWAHFQTKDGVIFSARQVLADFPAVSEFFDGEGNRVKLPEALAATVERVGVMADGDIDIDKKITLSFTTDKITCTGSKKGVGSLEEEVDTVYKKEPFEFSINPEFFSHILAKSTVMKLMEGKALFLSGNFKHLIALPMPEGE